MVHGIFKILNREARALENSHASAHSSLCTSEYLGAVRRLFERALKLSSWVRRADHVFASSNICRDYRPNTPTV